MSAGPNSPDESRAGASLSVKGAGDGVATECERCGKPGTLRQQFEYMGVTICYICADERVGELRSEGSWA